MDRRDVRVSRGHAEKAELLLLDEPLSASLFCFDFIMFLTSLIYPAGLDVNHRPKLTDLLKEIHEARKPRILISLRPQDPLPEWITHVAAVDGSNVSTGSRTSVSAVPAELLGRISESKAEQLSSSTGTQTAELVHMKGVNVRYHERHVRIENLALHSF